MGVVPHQPEHVGRLEIPAQGAPHETVGGLHLT
jgi:hypothetical protein